MFADAVYSDHNKTRHIAATLNRFIVENLNGDVDLPAINIGSGNRRIHDAVWNLDLRSGPNVDVVGDAEALPFDDESVQLAITQETLEHVRHPHVAMGEIARVLRVGGAVYCQLPFVIGYHPGPCDFRRYTREGIRQLAQESGLTVEEEGITVGPAFGFYRIAVEYFALLFTVPMPRLYHLAKAFFAIALYPVKLTDPMLRKHISGDKIAGGFYVIARKTHVKS